MWMRILQMLGYRYRIKLVLTYNEYNDLFSIEIFATLDFAPFRLGLLYIIACGKAVLCIFYMSGGRVNGDGVDLGVHSFLLWRSSELYHGSRRTQS